MKRRLLTFAFAVLTVGLLGSCSKINERIDGLDKRVYDLENNKIASVEQQITAINTSINELKAADVTINGKIADLKTAADAQQALIDALQEADRALGQKDDALEARIATLEGQVTTINGQIDALVDADIAINTRIDQLQSYVDTEIGKAKDWATTSFASLTEYQKTAEDLAALSVTVTGISTTLAGMQTSIAELDTKIDGIDVALQEKITTAKTELEGKISDLKTEIEGEIAEAIATSEAGLKSWVNEQLSAYYTAAQMDAKIDGLQNQLDDLKTDTDANKSKIEELETKLDQLTQALEDAKTEIKAAYKKAIKDAIEGHDGYITETIKNAIDEANGKITALTGRVDDLETAVGLLTGRIDALEEMIQTVSIIPAYNDGSVKVENGSLTITCVITPKEAVINLEKEDFTILVSEVLTKSALYQKLTIASDADLVLDVTNGAATIKVDVSSVLPEDEGKALTVAVNIKNGISDYTTEFVPISVINSSVTLRLTAEVSPGKNAYFRNTHCCFSPDRKTAYLPTQDGNLVAVDLVNHAVKWVWKTTEQLNNGCVNVACNPVTGDVYLRNKALKNDGFFAITPDGNTKWTVNDIQPLGNCFAVSSDGAAILACGTTKTFANNREFGAFSTTDGIQLDRCYQRGSEVSGEGVVDPFMFCNNAQMAIYKTDATYDYIILYGNEYLQFYTYNRTTKKFKAIQMVQPYSSWKSWADACSICPAVSPEGKIFIPSNTKGVIMVIDGSVAEPWNSISWMTIGSKNITGIVFDTDGNMIIGTRDGMTKVSKDKLAGGPLDNPVDPTADAIYVASIGKDVFTHSYPYVSASGDVYAACNNANPKLCGDIYYVPAASTGTCAPVEVYHSRTTTSAQSCFCVTDGALIFPTYDPAEIILKTNNGLKMPKTWCGYGGDPCASMNVAFAYGNK